MLNTISLLLYLKKKINNAKYSIIFHFYGHVEIKLIAFHALSLSYMVRCEKIFFAIMVSMILIKNT